MHDSVRIALSNACSYWDPSSKEAQDNWFSKVMGNLAKTGLGDEKFAGLVAEGNSCPCYGWSLIKLTADSNSACIGNLANNAYSLLVELVSNGQVKEKQEVVEEVAQNPSPNRMKRTAVPQEQKPNEDKEIIKKVYEAPATSPQDTEWTFKETKGACPNATMRSVMEDVCKNCPSPCTVSNIAKTVRTNLGDPKYAVCATGSLYSNDARCGHTASHFDLVDVVVTESNYCEIICLYSSVWIDIVVSDLF
jgi:hypothetical protein